MAPVIGAFFFTSLTYGGMIDVSAFLLAYTYNDE